MSSQLAEEFKARPSSAGLSSFPSRHPLSSSPSPVLSPIRRPSLIHFREYRDHLLHTPQRSLPSRVLITREPSRLPIIRNVSRFEEERCVPPESFQTPPDQGEVGRLDSGGHSGLPTPVGSPASSSLTPIYRPLGGIGTPSVLYKPVTNGAPWDR